MMLGVMNSDWERILAAGAIEKRAFDEAINSPRCAQISLLHEILADNAESAFAKRHGIDGETILDDYRARVPICEYAAFHDDMVHAATTGEPRLTMQTPLAFERTGGSSSGSKLIGYNSAMLASFRRAILVWLHELAARIPAITHGRFYATISPATRAPEVTPSGIPIGLPSDAAYLGEDLAETFMNLLAVPPQLGLMTDPADWQAATLAALIEAEDLSFISLWSPTFLLALIEALPLHYEAVGRSLTPLARLRFENATRGSTLDTQAIWPNLVCISCWTTGPSAAFAKELGALFPHAVIDPKGVLATEAPITLTYGDDARSLPALTSCFIEFIDADGRALLCDELSTGDRYRAIITTPGGLCRYDIGDLFECRAMQGGVPDLHFVGRSDLTCDLVGEKLEDSFVAGILSKVAGPALVAPRPDRRGYELIVGRGHNAAIDLAALDKALCANPQYAYARQIGQLDSLSLRMISNLARILIELGVAGGRIMGDIKTSGLMNQPLTGEFER